MGARDVHSTLLWVRMPCLVRTCPSCGTGLQIWVQNPVSLLCGNPWQPWLIQFLHS